MTRVLILLDAGIGLIFLVAPIAALILTIVISVIESLILNRKANNYKKIFTASLLTNMLSTAAGFIILFWMLFVNVLKELSELSGLSFDIDRELSGYIGRTVLLIIFFVLTLLVEIPLLKKLLKNFPSITVNDVIFANFISYILISVIFFKY
ncbi:MAG: hypothetical protein HXY49_01015 [Ignavibacteriaceae bacterium]|nr:hypothetical protein [Ignavibacteriaceae bacterium]